MISADVRPWIVALLVLAFVALLALLLWHSDTLFVNRFNV